MADDIISTAWVRIRAMGKDFGADVKKAINDGAKSADRDATNAGARAGGKFGDGFTTGADGKLRDSQGRFATYGKTSGESFASGFGGGLNKLAVNVWSIKTLAGALKSVTGPAVIATKAIGIAGAAGAAIALGGAAIGVVGALSQIAGVAPLVLSGLGALLAVEGTVKLATMGVSQAFKDSTSAAASTAAGQKKIAADMKGLAPNAAALVTQVLALKPAFTSLQQSVQNNFFAGFAGDVKSLASTFLPQLKVGLGGVATSLNGIVRSAAGTLK